MSSVKRVSVFRNGKKEDGKAVLVDEHTTMESFLAACAEKLQINARRIFTANGGEVDLDLVQSDDALYISQGEPFGATSAVSVGKNRGERRFVRLSILGGGGVGKSALTLRYCKDVFIEDYDPTVEDAYRKLTTVDGKTVTLDILDTAGQEEFETLRAQWMSDRDGFLFVFSLTDRISLSTLDNFLKQASRIHDKLPPIVLCGNKADLASKRVVTTQDVHAFMQKIPDISYLETSALSGQNVERAFQRIVKRILRQDPDHKPRKRFPCSIQ